MGEVKYERGKKIIIENKVEKDNFIIKEIKKLGKKIEVM
jgi:hypothetical protein